MNVTQQVLARRASACSVRYDGPDDAALILQGINLAPAFAAISNPFARRQQQASPSLRERFEGVPMWALFRETEAGQNFLTFSRDVRSLDAARGHGHATPQRCVAAVLSLLGSAEIASRPGNAQCVQQVLQRGLARCRTAAT